MYPVSRCRVTAMGIGEPVRFLLKSETHEGRSTLLRFILAAHNLLLRVRAPSPLNYRSASAGDAVPI
jgi:hypothetical protein